MNRRTIGVIMLFCVVMLSGCWDSTEPERMHYMFGLAVDYKDEQYEVYVQVINFENTAKSESPNSEEVQYEVGYATGKTPDEALINLYHSMGRKAFWGNLSYIILSEAILENEKMSPLIDLFLRYRETRYQILLYSTKDDVKDLLLTTPINDKSLTMSKLADPKNSFKQEAFIEPVDIRMLLIGLNEPSHEVAIPYVEVSENWETVEKKSKVVRISGVGVISPHEFKGFLIEDEANGLPWMTEKTKRKQLSTEIISDEKLTATLDGVKVEVEPIVGEDSVKFNINVKAKATVGHIEEEVTDRQVREAVEKQVEKEIKRTYEEALKRNIDIYRLSEYLYRQDVKAWKRFEKKGKVDLTEDSIRNLTVEVKVVGGRRNLKRTID